MNEIDKYLDEVCRTLGGSHDLREHVREEIKDHLTDAVEANVAKGLSKEDATRKAIEDFGKPEETRSGLESLYGHSLTAFLVDRAMAWKESNMKSGWKWSFTAMAILVTVMAMELLLSFGSFVFIFPRLQDNFQTQGEPLPAIAAAALKGALFLYGPWGWALLIAALVAWGLFEWRSKSENKAVIRLTCTACLTLVVTVVFAFVALGTVVGLAGAASLNYQLDPRSYAITRVSDAAAAMTRLQSAMQAGDKEGAANASYSFMDALSALATPRTARRLIPPKDPQQVERILSLIATMHDQNHWGRNLRDQKDLDELMKTWGLLIKEIQHDESFAAPGAG